MLNHFNYSYYLVQFHEFSDTVEHVMIFSSGTGHLLDDGSHVTKYRGVQQSWNTDNNLKSWN